MRTHGRINAILAVAAMGVSVPITRADDDLDERNDKAPPPPAPTVHKHSREIARRLRQEARKAEKAAARTPLQAKGAAS